MRSSDYILLDAAKMDGYIFMAKDMNEEHRCLYEGDSEKFLGASAPWLFELDRDSPFAEWVVELGAGNSWGIILEPEEGTETDQLYRHLRKFLIVHTEEGKELYFRYYDPRVLRVFLPTCDTEQLLEFFGPIQAFILEGEEGGMVQFQLNGNELEIFDLGMALKEWMVAEDHPDPRPIESSELLNPESDSSKGLEEKKDKWDFGF